MTTISIWNESIDYHVAVNSHLVIMNRLEHFSNEGSGTKI